MSDDLCKQLRDLADDMARDEGTYFEVKIVDQHQLLYKTVEHIEELEKECAEIKVKYLIQHNIQAQMLEEQQAHIRQQALKHIDLMKQIIDAENKKCEFCTHRRKPFSPWTVEDYCALHGRSCKSLGQYCGKWHEKVN